MEGKTFNTKIKQISIAVLLTVFVLVAAAVGLLLFQASLWAVLVLLLIAALMILLWMTPLPERAKRHAMYAATAAAFVIAAVTLSARKEMALFITCIFTRRSTSCFRLYI